MGTRRTAVIGGAAVLAALAIGGGAIALANSGRASTPATSVAGSRVDTPADAPRTVVVIGDSITAGLNLDDGEAWPELLGEDEGVTVVNDSCSGAGFIAVGDCGTDYSGLLDAAIAAEPDMVIIQSSDNDHGHRAPTIEAATSRTVKALRSALPDAQIVGLSTLYDGPGREPAEIAASSAALETAMAAVGGTFIDLGQPLRGQADFVQDDGEHPTTAGQEALEQAVIDALAQAGITL